MPAPKRIRDASQIGRELADHVLAQRRKYLRRRNAVVAELARAPKKRARKRRAPPQPAPKTLRMLGGPAPNGVLVAEGDSWFDYPMRDILDCLEDEHGYDVESVAHWGHRMESMAYEAGQLDDLTRKIEKVIRRGENLRAVLLSGGGNDVAGDAFETLLEHASSAMPGLNDAMVTAMLQRVELAYVTILSAITAVCESLLGRRVPILVHGYDYPVPDGRGFLGGFWLLPGPWLEPGFRAKGYEDLQQRIAIAGILIDRFNEMLRTLTGRSQLGHVRHVELRGSLSTHLADYEAWWANELHPEPEGFHLVTGKFATVLAQLP